MWTAGRLGWFRWLWQQSWTRMPVLQVVHRGSVMPACYGEAAAEEENWWEKLKSSNLALVRAMLDPRGAASSPPCLGRRWLWAGSFNPGFVKAARTTVVYRCPPLQIRPKGLIPVICQGLNGLRPRVDTYLQNPQTPLNRPLGFHYRPSCSRKLPDTLLDVTFNWLLSKAL